MAGVESRLGGVTTDLRSWAINAGGCNRLSRRCPVAATGSRPDTESLDRTSKCRPAPAFARVPRPGTRTSPITIRVEAAKVCMGEGDRASKLLPCCRHGVMHITVEQLVCGWNQFLGTVNLDVEHIDVTMRKQVAHTRVCTRFAQTDLQDTAWSLPQLFAAKSTQARCADNRAIMWVRKSVCSLIQDSLRTGPNGCTTGAMVRRQRLESNRERFQPPHSGSGPTDSRVTQA